MSHVPLTVEQLHKILTRQIELGQGGDTVALPWDPGQAGIGARPAVSVTGGGAGIDWDSGKFFLFPSSPISPKNDVLVEKMKKQTNDIGFLFYELNRLVSNQKIDADEKLMMIEQALLNFRAKSMADKSKEATTAPSKPKP